MDPVCLPEIKFCRTRVTLLDSNGVPQTGANASFVSDQSIGLTITADIEAATRRTVRNGCDCVLATDPGQATLLGLAFELTSGSWEPAMQSLMLHAADPIYDATTPTTIIGLNHSISDLIGCATERLGVGFEAWTQNWDGSNQHATLPWRHYVWPWTEWTKAPKTLGIEFSPEGLTGTAKSNTEWGSGPYDDVPDDGTSPLVVDFWAEFATAIEPPTASCGLQTVS